MMDEGDLLYMPTALPGLSAAEASELLQQTDRLIRTVVMLIYLKSALQERIDRCETITPAIVADAVCEGALLRLRPKAMTVAVTLAGLFPILWTGGAGAEVMRQIAAPLVGGHAVGAAPLFVCHTRGIFDDPAPRPRP